MTPYPCTIARADCCLLELPLWPPHGARHKCVTGIQTMLVSKHCFQQKLAREADQWCKWQPLSFGLASRCALTL